MNKPAVKKISDLKDKLEAYRASALAEGNGRGIGPARAGNLALASAATGVAALAVAPAAEAAIQYSGPQNIMLTGTPTNTATLLIDMDSDKYDDFVIVHYTDPNAALIIPFGEFDGTDAGTAGVIKYTGATGPLLKTLTVNYNITGTLDTAGNGFWKYGSNAIYPGFFGYYGYGAFQGQGSKYIGVRFTNETGEHFGWIQVDLAANSASINIIDWALEDTPGAPITAGTTIGVVPTLNEWGIIVLMTLLAAAAWKMNKPKLLQA